MSDAPYFDIGGNAPPTSPDLRRQVRAHVQAGVCNVSELDNVDWRTLVRAALLEGGLAEAWTEQASSGEEAKLARHVFHGLMLGLRDEHHRQLGELVAGVAERYASAQIDHWFAQEIELEVSRLEAMEEDSRDWRHEANL